MEKIKEIDDEDVNMIVGQIDPKEWEKECLRVEKKLNDISTSIK